MNGFQGCMGQRTTRAEKLNQRHRVFHEARQVGSLAIRFEIIWSGLTVERFEKGIYNESFSTEEDIQKHERFPKAEQ